MIRTHTFEGSSMLASGEYNDETEEMTITFANGKDYTYIDVPKRTWDELINAESAGKYFNNCKKSLKIKT
jgi:hypothetical protein